MPEGESAFTIPSLLQRSPFFLFLRFFPDCRFSHGSLIVFEVSGHESLVNGFIHQLDK
jgi:hypothetical protein